MARGRRGERAACTASQPVEGSEAGSQRAKAAERPPTSVRSAAASHRSKRRAELVRATTSASTWPHSYFASAVYASGEPVGTHPRAGEPDLRLRQREDDVGARAERRPAAAGRRVAQHRDLRDARGPRQRRRPRDPLQLDQRAHALLHPAAAGRDQRNHRQPARRGRARTPPRSGRRCAARASRRGTRTRTRPARPRRRRSSPSRRRPTPSRRCALPRRSVLRGSRASSSGPSAGSSRSGVGELREAVRDRVDDLARRPPTHRAPAS